MKSIFAFLFSLVAVNAWADGTPAKSTRQIVEPLIDILLSDFSETRVTTLRAIVRRDHFPSDADHDIYIIKTPKLGGSPSKLVILTFGPAEVVDGYVSAKFPNSVGVKFNVSPYRNKKDHINFALRGDIILLETYKTDLSQSEELLKLIEMRADLDSLKLELLRAQRVLILRDSQKFSSTENYWEQMWIPLGGLVGAYGAAILHAPPDVATIFIGSGIGVGFCLSALHKLANRKERP